MNATSKKSTLGAAVGMCLMACSGAAWSYSAANVGSCDSATCQVVSVSSGNLAAKAVFEYDALGGDLYVTLINASTFDIADPSQVMTALLFNMYYTSSPTTSVTFSPVSALMNPSGTSTAVTFDAQTIDAGLAGKLCEGVVNTSGTCLPNDNNVGGEWRHSTGFDSHQQFGNFSNAIHSAGLGLDGTPNFNGVNLEDPAQLDGGQYGIVGSGDNPNTDINSPTYNPVTQNAVQFKLDITNLAGNSLDLRDAGLIAGFQYGTTPGVPGTFIPIPGTLALLGFGVLALGWTARRRMH